ncbi:MAG: LirA/MavJ family T4SS effector [Deltaproteobacteria bacterium]
MEDWPFIDKPLKGSADPAMQSLLQDVVRVARFLAGGFTNPALLAALDQLEQEVVEHIRLRQRYLEVEGEDLLEALKGPRSKELTSRALSFVLVRALRLAQFELETALVPSGALERPIGILSSAQFGGVIRQMKHLKDPLVGVDHGEFTHMLQWVLIFYAVRAGALPLVNPVALVYSFLGCHYSVVQEARAATASKALAPELWAVACDRVSPVHPSSLLRGRDHDDFRCPDMLHLSLAGWGQTRGVTEGVPGGKKLAADVQSNAAKAARWPTLRYLFKARRSKRDWLFVSGGELGALVSDTDLGLDADPLKPGYGIDPTTKQRVLIEDRAVALTYLLYKEKKGSNFGIATSGHFAKMAYDKLSEDEKAALVQKARQPFIT